MWRGNGPWGPNQWPDSYFVFVFALKTQFYKVDSLGLAFAGAAYLNLMGVGCHDFMIVINVPSSYMLMPKNERAFLSPI